MSVAGAGPTQIFEPARISVRVEPMLRIQGYGNLEVVRPAVKNAAKAAALQAQAVFEPEACFRRIPIARCDGGVLALHGGTTLRCPVFDHFLGHCTEVVVFVLTVGKGLDDLSHQLNSRGDLLGALFVHAAAWLGVEDVSKDLANHLRHTARTEGKKLTRRLAPGYTFKVPGGSYGWTLEDQSLLFGLFDDHRLPVKVLDSGAMLPSMSRSGIFGIGPPR